MKRKNLLQKAEELRARQNTVSKDIPKAPNKEELLKEMAQVKDELKEIDPKIALLEDQIDELAQMVPNPPLDSVPEGKSEEENQIVNTHGQKPEFDFCRDSAPQARSSADKKNFGKQRQRLFCFVS